MPTQAKRLRSVTVFLITAIVVPIAIQVWSDAAKEQRKWHPVDWENAVFDALESRWVLVPAALLVGLFIGVRADAIARRRDANDLHYLIDRETPLAVAAQAMSLNSENGNRDPLSYHRRGSPGRIRSCRYHRLGDSKCRDEWRADH
jgi:hypothetical protein